MKNRAKCKSCETIIESFHENDFVTCKCGDISIDGGQSHFKCAYKNAENFLRVDDEGNVIVPTFKEKEKEKSLEEIDELSKPMGGKEDKRKVMIEAIEHMLKAVDNLPASALLTPVTQYDYASILLLLSSMLKLDSEERETPS